VASYNSSLSWIDTTETPCTIPGWRPLPFPWPSSPPLQQSSPCSVRPYSMIACTFTYFIDILGILMYFTTGMQRSASQFLCVTRFLFFGLSIPNQTHQHLLPFHLYDNHCHEGVLSDAWGHIQTCSTSADSGRSQFPPRCPLYRWVNQSTLLNWY
jgi:hypothetical protein